MLAKVHILPKIHSIIVHVGANNTKQTKSSKTNSFEIVELAIDTKTDTKTRDDFEFFFCRTDNGALSPPQTETQ